MRYLEICRARKKRATALNLEKNAKFDLWNLMYADFDYIHRNQTHLLAEIENKLEDLKLLKNELELLIDKAELDYASKEKIKKLAQKRVKKIIGR
ncbi:hypothetical protein [Gelidibacter japonicus]|uniref:hypothetical protein n=1 Tax=Gelidibacter japonicus TaxID=1962232 RepID=UPI003A8F0C23